MKKNIIVTRSDAQLANFGRFLTSKNINLVGLPAINISYVPLNDELSELLFDIMAFDCIVFTSHYAVKFVINSLEKLKIPLDWLRYIKLYVVGKGAARALEQYGLETEKLPKQYTAQSLATCFSSVSKGSTKVFFPKSNKSLGEIEDLLNNKGYTVVSKVVYINRLNTHINASSLQLIKANKIDCFAFTSPSNVEGVQRLLHSNQCEGTLNRKTVAAIGKTTKTACNNFGLKVDIVPKEFTVESMIASIIDYFQT